MLKTKKPTSRNTLRRTRTEMDANDRARIQFTDAELKQIADDIKADSQGQSCGGCSHALYGDQIGRCTLYGLNLFSKTAIACKRWVGSK